jgi:hypothetical protein
MSDMTKKVPIKPMKDCSVGPLSCSVDVARVKELYGWLHATGFDEMQIAAVVR